MDTIQLHLLINHLPIVGTYLALPMLLFAMFRRKEPGVLIAAIIVLLLVGIGSIIAANSGEEAEDIVENLPGISEEFVEHHEHKAELATKLSVVVAVISLTGLLWLLKSKLDVVPIWLPGLLLVLALILAVSMASAGHSGGQIRHTEIRADFDTSTIQIDDDSDHVEKDHHEHDDDDD